jgi:glycosyltransferase involved in cell wall biosynthesis
MHSSHINMSGEQMSGLRSMYNQLFLRLTARRSSRLIAISAFVKRALTDILDIPDERIGVVYHGGGIVEEAQSQGWSSTNMERTGGIFFVSTLYPHKNADQLVRAYALLRRRRTDVPPLTIAGGDTDGESPTEERGTERDRLANLASRLGVEDHVRLPGRISDDELLEYLATERLMVFPSSLEGFGIPALEAMQAGLPLIASNRTSIPEVVGDGGITVDPEDVDALADRMEEALFDEDVRERLIQAGRERGQQFSWKKTAEQTLTILDEAAQ